MIILFHNEIFPCEGSFTWMSLKLHLVYFPVPVYGCVCVCVYIYIYIYMGTYIYIGCVAAAAAKSLQSCRTLCGPIDGGPPGSPVPGILQARTLEWVAISFSNA